MHRTTPIITLLALMTACGTRRPMATRTPDPQAQLAWMGADAVLWQASSAEAYWLYRQAYDHAGQKLHDALNHMLNADAERLKERPPAVIVDIDETVLDNSPYQVSAIQRGRTFEPNEWRAWTDRAEAKACPGAVEFLRYAKSEGVEVFYITNRDIHEKASTLKNLIDLGFPDADEQHLLLMEGTSDKTERRERVRATHLVLLLVGDQLRDFDERFKDRSANYGKDLVDSLADRLSEYFILVPNPMYGTYREAIQGKGTDAEKLARMKAWFEINGY